MAASFNCCVVTLLVWSRRRTSLAASWTLVSKVVTQCWMSVLVQLSGTSSFRELWSFCLARASSSVVFLSARRAVPSAGAGEWDWSCWMRRLIKGAWKARACVVLLGMSVPCLVWRVSAMPSRSRRFSRISWRRCVTKTDSATLLVAMKPVYFPWLRVRAVYSAVPWYASCQGKMSNVGRPATPALRDHWVGCIARKSWWPWSVLTSQW